MAEKEGRSFVTPSLHGCIQRSCCRCAIARRGTLESHPACTLTKRESNSLARVRVTDHTVNLIAPRRTFPSLATAYDPAIPAQRSNSLETDRSVFSGDIVLWFARKANFPPPPYDLLDILRRGCSR